jgi:RES domain-containing protein
MVLIEAEFPDNLTVRVVDPSTLPFGWNAAVAPASTKLLGTRWVRKNETAVLVVPSAVIPNERNYLLNPKHPDFSRIMFRDPVPFVFDPRLK